VRKQSPVLQPTQSEGLCIFVQHAQSTYNVAGRVNGDHSYSVTLTELSAEQAAAMATELAGLRSTPASTRGFAGRWTQPS
jgi:broad specificity phosphatase PhoE